MRWIRKVRMVFLIVQPWVVEGFREVQMYVFDAEGYSSSESLNENSRSASAKRKRQVFSPTEKVGADSL